MIRPPLNPFPAARLALLAVAAAPLWGAPAGEVPPEAPSSGLERPAETSLRAPGDEEERRLIDEIERSVLAPEMESRRARLATPRSVEASSDALRDIWGRAEERLAGVQPLERRRLLLDLLRARAIDLLAEIVEGDGRQAVAREAIARARAEWLDRRKLRLFETIKNWCPNEDWTLTLADCSEDKVCARPQKQMIEEWLDLAMTDGEIERRMVEEAGTDKVLVEPRGAFSRAAPYLVLLAGLGLAAGIFWRWMSTPRRGRPSAGPRRPGEAGTDPAAEETAAHSVWEARLEREIERLEESR